MLEPGTKLTHYEIVSSLGVGGMGEVYSARDTKLGRDVAIKVLPEEFLENQERLARFQREARLLAQLNHPNIATLHGLEESDGQHFLVMELVEGETLAERIARGPIAVDDAIPIFIQMAAGLVAAHEKGIIHRDLKPVNVKLARDNEVKILDFGLAKVAADTNQGESSTSQSPTLTQGTAAGTLIGTAPYMSPEQVRGKTVDARADIWAFGCCLFEALTARRAFTGETVSDTLAQILECEPNWRALPTSTPREVSHVLRRCLRKHESRRLRHIGDVKIELEDAIDPSETHWPETQITRPSRRGVIGLALALVTATAAVATWALRSSAPVSPLPTRFSIDSPPASLRAMNDHFPKVAISSDGRRVAYIGEDAGGRRLYLREMGETAPVALAVEDEADAPFFSPDGEWVGFRDSKQRLRKISLRGGEPSEIVEMRRSGIWGYDGTIVYSPSALGGLWQVSDSGGEPTRLTETDPTRNERSHRWPHILPGGEWMLYTVSTYATDTYDEALIRARSLKTGEEHDVIRGGSFPKFVPTGHLLFARGGAVLAAPFDPVRARATGAAQTVLSDVVTYPSTGAAQFDVSATGTLVYLPGNPVNLRDRLVWVDRRGNKEYLSLEPGDYFGVKLSPDGRFVAVDHNLAVPNVWQYDLTRGSFSRLTSEAANSSPVWTPDGSHIVVSSETGGARGLRLIAVDAPSGGDDRLVEGPHWPNSFSPDGKLLLTTRESPNTGRDLWLVRRDGTAEPFLVTPYEEHSARFSPDGQWIAHVSKESGRNEVYLRPFADPERKRQISTAGGQEPLWAPSGREIFYRVSGAVMSVTLAFELEVTVGVPQLLFEDTELATAGGFFNYKYDVSPDGTRFLTYEMGEPPPPAPVIVVLNWTTELEPVVTHSPRTK